MRAFTLIEILISVFILSVVFSGVYMFLNMGEITYSADMGLLELHQQTRQAMYWMVGELRQTTGIPDISSNGERITFNTFTASGIQYYRDATQNQIIREYPTGTPRILCNYITSLSFCCWHDTTSSCDTSCSDSNLVKIQLNADKTIKGGGLSSSLKEQVRLRNISQ